MPFPLHLTYFRGVCVCVLYGVHRKRRRRGWAGGFGLEREREEAVIDSPLLFLLPSSSAGEEDAKKEGRRRRKGWQKEEERKRGVLRGGRTSVGTHAEKEKRGIRQFLSGCATLVFPKSFFDETRYSYSSVRLANLSQLRRTPLPPSLRKKCP